MSEIQRVFVQRGLKPGDRLPSERELAEQLSVGRSSLREAIQRLQAMGLVEVRHGIGAFFTSEPGRWLFTPLMNHGFAPRKLFAELVEARMVVETRLAALAAERATAEDIAHIRMTYERRANAKKGEYVKLGKEFHLAVARASQHDVFESMLKAVIDLYFDAMETLDDDSREPVKSFRARQQVGHDEILRMIEARDPTGAAEAMRNHLRALALEFPSTVEPTPTAIRDKETAQ